jgi:hypothetical protein
VCVCVREREREREREKGQGPGIWCRVWGDTVRLMRQYEMTMMVKTGFRFYGLWFRVRYREVEQVI